MCIGAKETVNVGLIKSNHIYICAKKHVRVSVTVLTLMFLAML